MTTHLDADAIARALPMRDAVDALAAAVGAAPFADVPQRLHLEGEGGTFLVMPAMAGGWAGAKLVTIVPDNPSRGLPMIAATYDLFGPPGLELVASLDGRALTELRTAAVSGLATLRLARADARRLVVVGAGVQARAHVLAMAAVLDLEAVRVVTRRPEAVDAVAAHARAHGLEVPVLPGRIEDVRGADVVCLCTSSVTPVLTGDLLPEGIHVNAVGAYRPDMRELDGPAVAASRVVVETRAAAMAEKGDLILAESEGAWSRASIVADLHGLVSGREPGRTDPAQRTLFASVGHAYEDLLVARAVVAASS